MYSNVVLNIFNNPKNAGRMKKPEGVADCYNEDQTAHVEFFLRIESGVITDCRFRAQANPYIVAICSTMTNMVKGKMCSMLFLDPYSIKKELGDDSDIDIMFCIDCMKMAVEDYKEKLAKDNKQAKIQTIEQSESVVETRVETENNDQEVEIAEEDDFGEDFIAGLFEDEFFEEE